MSKPATAKGFRAARLIVKCLRGPLTETERDELDDWLAANNQNRQLFLELSSVQLLEEDLKQFDQPDTAIAWQRVLDKISEKTAGNKKTIVRKIWWRTAAAVLVLTFMTALFWHMKLWKPAAKEILSSQYGGDVLPGSKKAELLLSDGSLVRLDTGTDSTFMENGSSLQRTAEGSLIYVKGQADGEDAWNTIHIPNGGEYELVLEDGTKVWLNAASTLRYPVRFTGKERRVELTGGEAYFDIAKNREKPFIVLANRMEIRALGTAFNVNTYGRADSNLAATLTEGKVLVTTINNSSFLAPGDQLTVNGTAARVLKADIEAVTAWKNGLFLFNGTDLQEVMQQLARWYDVKIEYDPAFRERKFFTGEIRRNVPVSKLLEMMELTGIARFRIMNNTIMISAYSP